MDLSEARDFTEADERNVKRRVGDECNVWHVYLHCVARPCEGSMHPMGKKVGTLHEAFFDMSFEAPATSMTFSFNQATHGICSGGSGTLHTTTA